MKVRKAARTVIIDENDLVALIDVRDGEYYKIPGGGIDDGETEEQAAIREALEETGCQVEIIKKIGKKQFIDKNPLYGETTHHSVCFLAKKIKEINITCFNDYEQSNKMKLIWVNFEKAIELFSNVKTDDYFASEINKRDFEFILTARNLI